MYNNQNGLISTNTTAGPSSSEPEGSLVTQLSQKQIIESVKIDKTNVNNEKINI